MHTWRRQTQIMWTLWGSSTLCLAVVVASVFSLAPALAFDQLLPFPPRQQHPGIVSSVPRGLSPQMGLILDLSRPGVGGIRQRWTARGLLDLGVDIDLQPWFGWEGGTFFASYQIQHGRDASRDIGDIQAFSNIDAENRSQVGELWYEQWLFERRLRFKIGRLDANSEFAYVEHGAEFLHSSMGPSPAIFVMPTYPDPASSVNLFVYPTERLSLGFGVYDGAASRGVRTGVHGPHTLQGGDLFFIGEIGSQWMLGPQQLPGRLGLGGWGHTGIFAQFSGQSQRGTAGFYLVFDHTIWREQPPLNQQGIAMFLQYGSAQAEVSEMTDHIGGGFTWTGLFPDRDTDMLGLGASWVHLSRQAGFRNGYELALELFYSIPIADWAVLKPDVQYILHPAGGMGNTLVGTLRIELSF